MKNVKLLMILIILLMVLVGCPNDNAAQTENTGTAVQNKITSLQAVIDSDDTKSGDTIDLSQYSDITNYSANINKALTINGAGKDFGQAVITADVDGIGLTGMQNVGTLTASASLGNGSLKISGSSLSNLNILGGGSHSIYIEDHTNIGILTVDKILTPQSDEPVRLVLDDTVKIGKIIVKSGLFVDATDDMSVEIGNVIFDVSGDAAAVIAISRRVTADQTTDAASVNVTIRDKDIPQASITMLCAEDTIIPTEFVTAAFETLVAPLSADGLVSLQDKLSAGLSVPLTENAVIAVEGLVDSCGTVHRVIIENMRGSGILPNVIDLTSDYKLPVPENQGMVFIGWSLIIDDATSDQTIDTLCANDDYSGAIILYARWTAGTVAYTVKRLFQTVSGDDYEQDLTNYPDLSKTGLTDTTTDVTADTVTGFTALPIVQQSVAADGSTVVEVRYNRSIIIYTFDAAGGKWDGDTDTTTVSGRFGADVTLPANPTRAGYTFSGWSPSVPQTFGAEPTSYTAQWTINHYTVTFMNDSNVYTTQDVTYDFTVIPPETDPIKQATDTARYTFAYWYAEGQDNGYDFNTPITASLTLHAKWNVTPLYKVTIGSVTNGTVTADKTSGIEKGTEITLTVTPNSGYFRDDLSVKDSSGVVVTVTDNKFTMPASNVTVTATFKNTVNANGNTLTVSSSVTVTSSTTSLTNNGWYLVSQDVTIESRITVNGTANIILCDGATLTAKMGIAVESGKTLNIYASTSGTGKLVAGLENDNPLYYQYSQMNYAGIGGKAEDMSASPDATACGAVNVYGGNIIATGGNGCPGIGGGASGGAVTIYGGSVEAIGGPWDYENPGISCTLTVGSGLTVYAGDSSPGTQTTAAAYSNNRSAYVHIYK